MTTIVLVGGNETGSVQFGDKLAREVAVRFEQPPRILSCQFAKRDLSARQDSANEWLEFFGKYFPGSQVIQAEEDKFYKQVDRADIIYLHGGSTDDLFAALPDSARSRRAFAGKMVIGSSAGANYLAADGYSPDAKKFCKGIGLAPVGVLVHYGSESLSTEEWRQVSEQQLQAKGDYPVVCLPEGEFTVLEVAL